MNNATPGWYDTAQGRRWWDGANWAPTGQPVSTQPPSRGPDAGKLISALGALLVLGVVAFAIISCSAYSTGLGDKLEQAWTGLTPTAQQAYCQAMERDPYTDGPALGLAALVNDPNVDYHAAKSFLFDTCFPNG